MFLDSDRKVLIDSYTHFFDSDKFSVHWEGLIFIKGIPSGVDSIRVFLDEVSEKGIRVACKVLSGNFCCVLHDKLPNTYYVFIDNDGLSRLFYDDQLISSSFLALTSRINVTLTNLNPFSIIEFIHSGRILGSKPFFNSINILSPHEILIMSDQGMELTSKEIERTFPPLSHEETFLDTFTKIVVSLRNRKLKLHLTGGADSRLLALLFMKERVIFDTFTVGAPGNLDLEIAKKLAEHLELNHQSFYHPVADEESTLRDLEEIFETFDGLFDTLELYQGYHSHQRTKHPDTDLVVSGRGGVLYKFSDWQSLRKESRETAINRLVKTGHVNWNGPPHIPYDIFSDRFRKYASDYMPWLVNNLKTRFTKNRGKTLELKIWYEYSSRGDYRLSNDSRVLKVYAPLLERDLVACAHGITGSGFDRFFCNFHRKIINSLNPMTSQIEITSPLYGYVKGINWLFGKVKKKIENQLDKFRRLGSFSRKSRTENEQTDWNAAIVNNTMNWSYSLHDVVKHSRKGHENIEYLKTCAILNPDIVAGEIDNLFFGRLFSLAQLLKRMRI